MAYNTKAIVRDIDGNPISQYYNKQTDKYEAVEGVGGSNKIVLYDESGVVSEQLNLDPILETLNRLTGTVVSEESRKTNESERIVNEEVRVTQEKARVDAEADRSTSEANRVSQEDGRLGTEQIRVGNEEARVSAESLRAQSESDRAVNEDTRVFNESDRVSNEDLRLSNELTRESNEDQRVQDEGVRLDRETARVAAENDRVSNESVRLSQELTRESNESERQTNESTRVSNMNIVEEWIANPSQFNGKDIEYTWRGTELGIKLEGNPTYEYVDLKGDTGEVQNLTPQHIQSALGFIPVQYTAGSNIGITNGEISVIGQLGLTEAEVKRVTVNNAINSQKLAGNDAGYFATAEQASRTAGIVDEMQLNMVFKADRHDTASAGTIESFQIKSGFASGITGPSKIDVLHTRDGLVILRLDLILSVKFEGARILTLPVGIRPKGRISNITSLVSISMDDTPPVTNTVEYAIFADGSLHLDMYGDPADLYVIRSQFIYEKA